MTLTNGIPQHDARVYALKATQLLIKKKLLRIDIANRSLQCSDSAALKVNKLSVTASMIFELCTTRRSGSNFLA